jgi:hypothetical protein
MKPSKYLEKFKRLADKAKSAYRLTGDYILVEHIPDEELKREIKTDDGRTIALTLSVDTGRKQLNTLTADRPNWVRVLAVGEGYYTQEVSPETGATIEKTIPLDVVPGDIILVSQVSVKYFSVYGELEGYEAHSIGVTKESEIIQRFLGEDGYNLTFACLNQTPESQVVDGRQEG